MLFQIVFYAVLSYFIFFVLIIGYSMSKVYGEHLCMGAIVSHVSDLCSETFSALSSSVECYAINAVWLLPWDYPY